MRINISFKYILVKLTLISFFIQIFSKYKISENTIYNEDGTHNVSISIAAAITAYARVHMSKFKNNPKINLYYTDTDSVYTDSKLDENLLSETILGKLKLSNTCKKLYF